MVSPLIPSQIGNWIGGVQRPASGERCFPKINPHNGEVLWQVSRSDAADVGCAIAAAEAAQPAWADTPPVTRGDVLRRVAIVMEARRDDIARVVALETGKSFKSTLR